MSFEFKIGETIKDTDAFGTVIVRDIFVSTTFPLKYFCYRVENPDNPEQSWLCSEEEIMTEETHPPQE
jgi:hypothetical protein